MVISVNNEPLSNEFELLLNSTITSLQSESVKYSKKYSSLLGTKLEQEVFDILSVNSRGTAFEGSIELISGQKFPDIIAKKYYGVEVKTTKSNHWKTTGSSVMEGTRVEGIERIFLLFGKLAAPIEFKCRPYEDCLSEVVVTHSPRYLIDMNLRPGETIFDKLEVPYNTLRKQANPIKTILEYYKKKMMPGDEVWYLDSDSNSSTSLVIKIWNNLSIAERQLLMSIGFCLFPELLSNRLDKYNRFAIWLSTREGIICPNVRDIFSAGGQATIIHNEIEYNKTPKVLLQLYNNLNSIKTALITLPYEVLAEHWGCEFDDNSRYEIWRDMIIANSKSITKNELPIECLL